MKITFKLLITAVGLSVLGCQSTTVETSTTVIKPHVSDAIYQVEQAAANDFMVQSRTLNAEFTRYCDVSDRTNQDKQQLNDAWHSTMTAWMALQGQERGPVLALEQSWNIQFWPDKKNTTGRKMSALMQSDKTWTSNDIAQQSVTVQGLGAIEWLLYDSASSLNSNVSTCETGVAISRNLYNKANLVSEAWASNPWLELDQTAWDSEYIALLSNQLDYSMKKLSRPMAKIGNPRPYFSESWRSNTSMKNLKANAIALKKLYLANEHGLDKQLRQRDKGELANRIVKQFDLIIDTWPEDESLFELLQSKSGYSTVIAQYNKFEQLRYLIHEEVAIELGVVIGFNATDGD